MIALSKHQKLDSKTPVKDSSYGQIAGKSVAQIKADLDKLAVETWESTDHSIFDRFYMRTLKDLNTVYLAANDNRPGDERWVA